MAESPTPETGTPESQSPARTPPALITTEELLQSMVAKSPEAGISPYAPSPSGSVSQRAPVERYEFLRAADAGHRLQGLRLPPEEELRAAALGGRPAVGPPPRLPHQLSPALQSVLIGWRSVYESCRTTHDLQALVGDCYAHDAVFEDALVSARGQEAVYRQFAMLGAAVRSVQVAAYSLSVAPLSRPVVFLEGQPQAAKGPAAPPLREAARRPGSQQQQQPVGLQAVRSLTQQQVQLQRQQQQLGLQLQPEQGGAGAPGHRQLPQPQAQPLHLTRVTVENVQCFELGLPPWLTWLVGGKAPGLQVHLYVTSILLVASDAPLAVGSGGGLEAGGWPADVTASRLAGAAAALGRDDGTGGPSGGGGLVGPRLGGAGGGGASFPSWRIVHQMCQSGANSTAARYELTGLCRHARMRPFTVHNMVSSLPRIAGQCP
ncbi:hypothetical protein VOLCADRAFT_95968 [Volvox carteri f. nagariensis]|uniref:Uncharacterized protein n=1 Tax=Volvox carteri f. nagariensis TaxID=3068 RepID=D8U8V2_VOLCA|nr:uncharacterized protein VOLCADRAFT_95968 [Volvox carteri f. nagariensis]EFJ43870.1 hypothetical protein VOLCADRAFT_95968 [Volvox carteri f. nagariensis]|eukprot:XP_002955116.1 hypothetical protein VOLCADRAFT_95968 [Volvox carteri f. nagariensis]